LYKVILPYQAVLIDVRRLITIKVNSDEKQFTDTSTANMIVIAA